MCGYHAREGDVEHMKLFNKLKKIKKSSFAIVVLILITNLAIWAFLNQPEAVPPWQGIIRGVSFSPYQKNQDPFVKKFPSAEDIDRNLQVLKGRVAGVRTYSSADGLELVPGLAKKNQLRVTAGAWLDTRMAKNDVEIRNLIKNAQMYDNIDRLIVGNEAILRSDLSIEQLSNYLKEVKSATNLLVSTAEPWHVWLKYPELAKEVDYITIHVLPYWEKVPISQSVTWVWERYQQVAAAFPDKKVVLGEVGWPSNGQRRGKAKPSLVNQAKFVRTFLTMAAAKNLDYFVMEAFDQPWKKRSEGTVGRHWGLFDVTRQSKFSMTGDIVEVSLWPWQVAASTVLALVPMVLFLMGVPHLKTRGQVFFFTLIQISASVFTGTAFVPFTMDLTLTSQIIWGVLLPAQLALFLVLLVNGFELTEVLWTRQLKRLFPPIVSDPEYAFPKVSVHLAIYNEPPAMVMQTLDGLARLDYPDYEVLVVDNNTKDEAVWGPVEAYCAALGPGFRFFHLPQWPGFKAGALNVALRNAHPDAQIIGVIDSDYLVQPNWLRSLVPYFKRPEVALVQAPQDNREWEGDGFKTMCNWEYSGFFQIGMVQRNERNAIIQHGTMTLMRKSAIDCVGEWSEWCITEDAEMGLRVLRAGYESVYVNHDFGKGIPPDSFAAYKGQRFRWAYGSVQILRKYWRWFVPGKNSGLTMGQKFHFATGWFLWFADALSVLFTFAGVLWTIGLLLWPQYFEFPLPVFLFPAFGLFVFKLFHSFALYKAKVTCTFPQRIGAAVAGMSLTHTIAKAIFKSLCTNNEPFLRTPKGENRPAFVKGILMAREELQMLSVLLLAALSIVLHYGIENPEALLWVGMLLVQSSTYGAALTCSLINSMPQLRLTQLIPGWSWQDFLGISRQNVFFNKSVAASKKRLAA